MGEVRFPPAVPSEGAALDMRHALGVLAAASGFYEAVRRYLWVAHDTRIVDAAVGVYQALADAVAVVPEEEMAKAYRLRSTGGRRTREAR